MDQRLREIANITLDQCGFVRDMSTSDAVHAVSLLPEKYREKHRTVHAVFFALKKAFDRFQTNLSGGISEHIAFLKGASSGSGCFIKMQNATFDVA